jgi:hypothetical protein
MGTRMAAVTDTTAEIRKRCPGDAALLVDDYLLDSYLAAAALRPKRAHLIHVDELQPWAHRLRRRVERRLGIKCALVPISDDTDSAAVLGAVGALPGDTHLHLTGGTGAMAALAAHHWPGRSSWLDEDRDLLRFDDGFDVDIGEVLAPADVTFDDILSLAGFKRRPAREIRLAEGPTAADALMLLDDPASVAGLAAREQLADQAGRVWRRFLAGGWLETAVAARVVEAMPAYPVETGLVLRRDGGGQLELDVVAMGHYRPYVISCTTSAHLDSIRSRLFEVEVRATQLGGPAARPALVCLTNEAHHGVDALLGNPWPSKSAARVFRPPDLAAPARHFAAWLGS